MLELLAGLFWAASLCRMFDRVLPTTHGDLFWAMWPTHFPS